MYEPAVFYSFAVTSTYVLRNLIQMIQIKTIYSTA